MYVLYLSIFLIFTEFVNLLIYKLLQNKKVLAKSIFLFCVNITFDILTEMIAIHNLCSFIVTIYREM